MRLSWTSHWKRFVVAVFAHETEMTRTSLHQVWRKSFTVQKIWDPAAPYTPSVVLHILLQAKTRSAVDQGAMTLFCFRHLKRKMVYASETLKTIVFHHRNILENVLWRWKMIMIRIRNNWQTSLNYSYKVIHVLTLHLSFIYFSSFVSDI